MIFLMITWLPNLLQKVARCLFRWISTVSSINGLLRQRLYCIYQGFCNMSWHLILNIIVIVMLFLLSVLLLLLYSESWFIRVDLIDCWSISRYVGLLFLLLLPKRSGRVDSQYSLVPNRWTEKSNRSNLMCFIAARQRHLQIFSSPAHLIFLLSVGE